MTTVKMDAAAWEQQDERIISQLFGQYGKGLRYKKNNFVFREDDECGDVYLVQEGLIKISQSAREGQGITLFLRGEGEAFGLAEVLTGQSRQRYARCILDSFVLALPAATFREQLLRQPEVLYAVTRSNARRLLSTQRYAETLVSRPVAWRLAHFLLQLGKPAREGMRVELPLSHEEISYIIGCTRQTVSETLSLWRTRGWVEVGRKRIRIGDPVQLIKMVEQDEKG
jgi:CRP-like cAMP-binding protein